MLHNNEGESLFIKLKKKLFYLKNLLSAYEFSSTLSDSKRL
ncbi:hypothetical protein [Wolbachia phage WO]|nr:hypothetical protein [Wolbachia phage WO]